MEPVGPGRAPPRRRLAPAERREHLLDVALELAAGGDVAAVSVRDLSARAGISEGLLYHYFPTKDALVEAAVRRAADALLADIGAVPPAGPPRTRLLAALGVYLDHVQAQPTGWKAVLQATGGMLAAIGEEVEQASLAVVLAALQVREPSPALAVALAGWAGLERDACLRWLEHPEVPRAMIEELVLHAFLAALGAVAPHDPEVRSALARLVAED